MPKLTETRRLLALVSDAQKAGGYTGLAQSILIVAIMDWRKGGRRNRDSVRSFWYSDYGRRVRGLLGLGEVRIEDIASSPVHQRRLNQSIGSSEVGGRSPRGLVFDLLG